MKVLTVGMMVCDIPLGPVPKTIFLMEKAEIEAPRITTGGDALNVAVTLSKLGVKTAIVGRVGLDDNGKTVLAQTKEKGVDIRYVISDTQYKTAVSYLLLDEDGEKHALSDTKIYQALGAQDIPDEAILESDLVYFGSAFQMNQMDCGGILQLFQRVHALGKKTALDTAMNDQMESGELLLQKMMPVLAETDIFLPSLLEASYLTGLIRPDEIAEKFGEAGVKLCGVKLGEKGCYITDFNEAFYLDSFRTFQAVDTTGAGDAFVGGFLYGVLMGYSIKQCGEFACAVAAHNVAVKGATEGVPDSKTILKFLKENNRRIQS